MTGSRSGDRVASWATGCITRGRGYVAGAIILISVVTFYTNPFGRESMFYPWLPILAMILVFSPVSKRVATYLASMNLKKVTFAVALTSFIGTLTDHPFESALGIWYFYPALGPEIWNLIMFVYPIERIVAVATITAIGAPVYRRLKSTGYIDTPK
jgi:hypothetical protein